MPPSTLCFVTNPLAPLASRRASPFLGRHLVARPSSYISWNYYQQRKATVLRACAEKQPAQPNSTPPKPPEQTFFGLRLRTNGDVLKFGVIATIIPFGIKALIQAMLVQLWPSSQSNPDLLAGQITTGFVSIFALLAWVSTYVFRVGTKQMTYAQQLREYEDQVIQKRYEELTEEELAALTDELNDEA